MSDWTSWLARWTEAGLIDPATAGRIRDFEQQHVGSTRLRWPIVVALAFGALMLAGGVLLFVAAHWDALSPGQRFAIVILLVGGFHVAGAVVSERFPGMSSALHAIGTIALGGGIALAGQIFNLAEHWPAGILWWAVGAVAGWVLLRQIPQLLLLAILVPAWLQSEWIVLVHERVGSASGRLMASGLLLLALAYLTAPVPGRPSDVRRALMWLGGIALLPAALSIALIHASGAWPYDSTAIPAAHRILGWTLALALPILVAFALRRVDAWPMLAAVAWLLVLLWLGDLSAKVSLYGWWALGAIGLVAWGVHDGRGERVNLGAAIFAATVITFYFSQVMDKLGRSASLVGFGLLFLAGGWVLERIRRRLIQQARGASS